MPKAVAKSIEEVRSQRHCPRHGDTPCACGMGNLFRFVEPLLLLDVSQHPGASGYDILQRLQGHTLTGTTIDKAAVYRTLCVLERNGMTVSEWTESARGAGRKSYRLTERGREHLVEWVDLLDSLASGLTEFVREGRAVS
jgi:DNA-binding PadR family transcriptional regulator